MWGRKALPLATASSGWDQGSQENRGAHSLPVENQAKENLSMQGRRRWERAEEMLFPVPYKVTATPPSPRLDTPDLS